MINYDEINEKVKNLEEWHQHREIDSLVHLWGAIIMSIFLIVLFVFFIIFPLLYNAFIGVKLGAKFWWQQMKYVWKKLPEKESI